MRINLAVIAEEASVSKQYMDLQNIYLSKRLRGQRMGNYRLPEHITVPLGERECGNWEQRSNQISQVLGPTTGK